MSGRIRLILLALFACAVLCQGAVCLGQPVPETTLRSASELDYPPFALVTPDGKAAGFSVDLLKAVARAVRLDVTFQVAPWNVIKQELADGEIDVLPFMSYSADRAKTYDFTIPYLRMHGTIFVRKGNADIRGEKDLKDKEVIVMRGDTAHDYAVANHLSGKLILTDSYEEALKKLSQGEHDAVIVQQVAGWQLVKKLGIKNLVDVAAEYEESIRIRPEPLSGFEQKFCIAVRKGNAPLLAKLNEGLAIVFANGEFDALYAKWFEPILPGRPIDTKTLMRRIAFILIPSLAFIAFVGLVYFRREVARKTLVLRKEIKERLQVEKALRASKEQLQFVLQGGQLGYWDWDIKNDKVSRNALWAEMLGYEADEIDAIPGSWTALVHPDDRDEATRSIEEHLAGRTPMHRLEYRMRAKNGDYKWILDQAKVVEWDEDGNPIRMCGAHADVTERKMAETARRESDIKLEAAMASLTDGLFITNASGFVTHYNEAFARLCRFKDKSECAMAFERYPEIFDVYFPDGTLAPPSEWAVSRALRGEHVSNAEYVIHRKDISERWTGSYSFSPILDECGAIVGTVTIVRDITQNKIIESQLRDAKVAAEMANRAKSEFLANMSHELRTPLNGVLGMLQLLGCTEQTDEQTEYVDAAIKATKRLTRLLGDILDISRIEAGKMQLIETEFSVSGLRDATMELFSIAAREKGLEFSFDIDRSVPQRLVGDETRIRQILFNLVGNAVKFTRKGGVRITMSDVGGGAENRTRILFTVSDDGIGFPDDLTEKIFDPFTQAEASYTRRFQGAGLGLSIVRNLVGLLGGVMSFENEPGAGAVFHVSLPFALPEKAQDGPKPDLCADKAQDRRLRILVAEDDETNQLTARLFLQKLGHEVVVAENGSKAVEWLSRRDFDLVLMDVQMPVMDGVEATRRIRDAESSGAKPAIPIIAMTAYAMSRDRERFLEAGMNGYIPKPVDYQELQAVIRKALRGNPDE